MILKRELGIRPELEPHFHLGDLSGQLLNLSVPEFSHMQNGECQSLNI